MPPKKKEGSEEKLTRIAIVNPDKCKPKKCKQECKKNCPVVRMGKLCIEVVPTSKLAYISEELCIGCGICVKKCPFEAINIINLPKDLENQTTHRYGPNSFKLHRLPMPRPGQVLGLVGTNGIGKSTALKVLAGKLKPNLGKFENPPDWKDILLHFRGSELQNFFHKLLEDDIKAIIKPQYVDHIPKAVKGKVEKILETKDDRKIAEEICAELDLSHLMDRQVGDLSGGELQRFAIAVCCVQDADIYMFDEPSSYLDVRQRLRAGAVIRGLCRTNNYVVVVEHDLSVLDYLSDFVCCLYGKPGAYGVVTMPFSVREGINIFLAGFVPTENLRFRQVSLTFKVAENVQDTIEREKGYHDYKYPDMTKNLGKDDFKLNVEAGSFSDSEIIVMLGQNGTGKTTFIRMLAGIKGYAPDGGKELPKLNVSYKPQKIAPSFGGSVRQLLHSKIQGAYVHPQFVAEVMKPMQIEEIMDQEVKNLSGGELQRVAIVLTLGKPADIYLIDEPSAYLDSEQRIVAARVIKRFILHAKKTAFIVEHDFIMATYLADRVIVYSGQPGVEATAHSPQSLISGMNTFLKDLEITFRRDPTNYRPRINKMHSVKDQEQKRAGTYFYIDTDDDDDDDSSAPVPAGKPRPISKRAAKVVKSEKPTEGDKKGKKDNDDDLDEDLMGGDIDDDEDDKPKKGKKAPPKKAPAKGSDKAGDKSAKGSDKPKPKPKGKDKDEDEDEEAPAKKTEKKKPKTETTSKEKPAGKAPAKKSAPKKKDDDAEQDDDEDGEASKKKPAPKKKAEGKKKVDDGGDGKSKSKTSSTSSQKPAGGKKTTPARHDEEVLPGESWEDDM